MAGELARSVNNHEAKTNGYLQIFNSQWELSGCPVDSSLRVYNSDREEVPIFINEDSKPLFILYFEWDQCQDCIAQELAAFSKIDDLLSIKVIISFDSFANYLAYCESWTYPYPVYFLPKGRSVYEGAGHGYGVHTFIVNNGVITNPHIASASFPELSDIYYKTLSKKFENY